MKSFTRRLSLLVALILLITVGGVYATWEYAASAGVSEEVNKGVSLTPVTQSGSIGEYEVAFAEFSILLDQTAPGDYTPKLSIYVQSGDGSLDFTFTPTTIASDSVKTNGVESTVSFSSMLAHNGTAIFSFPSTITIGTADSSEPYKWVKQADGSFTCSISNADLYNYIQLNYTDKLDTYGKYQEMEAALKGGTITIAIFNDYSAPSTGGSSG